MKKVFRTQKKYFVLCLAWFIMIAASAQKVEINGIWYKLDASTMTASVTNKSYGSATYEGNVDIPSSIVYEDNLYDVTEIDHGAFSHCENLQEVTMPSSIVSIGETAFLGCNSLKSIEIPDGVVTIGMGAFISCKALNSIEIPEGVTQIEDNCFSLCTNMESVTLPTQLKSIGKSSFNGLESLKSIVIPNQVVSIGESAFSMCKGLKSVILPDELKVIERHAFIGCPVNSLELPSKIERIENHAFAGAKMEELVLPETLEFIGDNAFLYAQLKVIKALPVNPPVIEGRPFYFSATVIVPSGCINTYKITDGWKNFTNITENDFKLTYYLNDEVYKTYHLEYGAAVTPEQEPVMEGCSFSGWSEIPETMPAHDVDVYGTFIDEAGINDYLNAYTGGYSMTQVGSYVTKNISFFLQNNHRDAILIKKVVVKHPTTGSVLATSEDESLLGELNGGESKGLSVTIHEDITPVYEWYYAHNGRISIKNSAETVMEPKYAIGNLDYCITGDNVKIIDVYNLASMVIIPQSVKIGDKTYQITAIDNQVFDSCTNLQNIVNFNSLLLPVAWNTSATIYTVNRPVGEKYKDMVIFDTESKEYSGTAQQAGWTNNLASLGFSAVAHQLASHTDVGSYTDDADFTFTYGGEDYSAVIKAILIIKKAPLTIAAGTYTRKEGENNPDFVLTYTGFKGDEDNSVLLKMPIATCTATQDSPVGEYPVTVSGAEAQNYDISYLAGTLVVTERPSYYLKYYVDDVEYRSYFVKEGTSITPEPAPTKEGYSFSGWSEIPETMPTHDVIVTGSFSVNQYKLTYMVDGEIYMEQNIDFGTTITPAPAPTKEGYIFSGWSEIPYKMPAHDVMVTGTFSANLYVLTYIVDGQEYKTYDVPFGTQIVPEEEPVKEGYTFSGWSEIPEIMPAHTVIVTGTFTANKYLLTYLLNSEVYKVLELELGTAITPEPAPEREGHTFSGWSEIPEIMPAHDVMVTGTLTVNKYILTYIVDGKEYKTFELDYGTAIIPEEYPVKEGYTFSGWSEIPETMPAHIVIVTGAFSINQYELTYMIGGEIYKRVTYEFGATITPEPIPDEGYVRFEWIDVPETMPAHDVVVYADYETGIAEIMAAGEVVDVYTTTGLLVRHEAKSLKGLRQGVYILRPSNNRKHHGIKVHITK